MDKVTTAISQFFRYVYGGVLVLIILTLLKMPGIEMVYLDGAIFFAVSLTLGAAIYMVYKNVISEGLIDDKIHFKMPGHSDKCVFTYLGERGVRGRREQLAAFRVIRDDLFGEKVSLVFEKRQAEIHLLYLTAAILFFAGLGSLICLYAHMAKLGIFSIYSYKSNIVYVGIVSCVLCLLSYWVGIRSDLSLCSDEKTYFKILESKNEYKKVIDGVIESIKKDEDENKNILVGDALLGVWSERILK
ncbi:MAG: hypothetical protein WCY36_07825 [Candidatus Omnitrophota bacterium]